MPDAALFEYLLRLGDNDLVLSQRLGEWCGRGPALEEDIALTNTALDLLGQGRFWLSYAGETEGAGRDEDQLAFLRDAREFHNLLLLEQPNGSFGQLDFGPTIARQFLFDAWHCLLLERLSSSGDERIAGIAEKALKEVTYHRERSADWIVRLGDGTEESHTRIQSALDGLWMFTGEMFEMDPVEQELLRRGVGCDLSLLRAPWMNRIEETLDRATLTAPKQTWMQHGGKRGIHTEKLGYLLAEMQFMQRTYAGMQW